MNKQILLAAIFATGVCTFHLAGQTISPPAIEWQRSFGGTNGEEAYCVRQTSDGGFVVGGVALFGVGGNRTSPGFGGGDFWVVRLDRSGNKLWDRSFGGDALDVLFDLQQTTDGGFILAGFSCSSNTGNKDSPHFGDADDGWVVRLDAEGNKLWDRSYGSTNFERFYSVQQTRDGGFVLAGDVGSMFVAPDWQVLWIDANGNVLKERRFGGDGSDWNPSVRLTMDGGYVVVGHSSSPPSGNKTSPLPGGGGPDLWVVRLDENGDMLWDKSYGGAGVEQWASVEPTADGGFALAISSQSSASGNKTSDGFGREDIWVVRVDAQGNQLWEQSLGGTLEDLPGLRSMQQTADGGFIVGGSSMSGINGNKTSPFYGPAGPYYFGDFWVVRLDANGNKLWDQSFGGSNGDYLQSLAQTSDGGFILAGGSQSPMDGNKTSQGFGGWDFWVIKLGPDGLSMPPKLRALPQTAEGIRSSGFRLLLEGMSNQNYVVEASMDQLMWSAFMTNRLSGVSAEITDASATKLSQRFYRARPMP